MTEQGKQLRELQQQLEQVCLQQTSQLSALRQQPCPPPARACPPPVSAGVVPGASRDRHGRRLQFRFGNDRKIGMRQ